MADFMTSEQRSAHMAKIRSKDTKPELWLRRELHGLGYRYFLHDRRLPGKPDLVFPGRRKVLFVNGCFWHGHHCPVGSRLPKTNTEFWTAKRLKNQERDLLQRSQILELGWQYLDVWECAIDDDEEILASIRRFLDS